MEVTGNIYSLRAWHAISAAGTSYLFPLLYYLLNSPHEIRMYPQFDYEGSYVELKSVQEGDACEVCFNNKWFHDRDDFFARAEFDGVQIKYTYRDFWRIEVVQ